MSTTAMVQAGRVEPPQWRAIAMLAPAHTSREVRAQAEMALQEGWYTVVGILTTFARDLEAQGR